MPDVAFVTPPAAPLRAGSLVAALRDELHALGVRSQAAEGVLPPARAGLVHVLVGARAGAFAEPPPAALLARSIAVLDVGAATAVAGAGAVLHLEAGRGAEHLALGHSARWTEGAADVRDIDVLVGGPQTRRRDQLLATYAPTLARHRFRLALGGELPDELLRRARVVLDVGPDGPALRPAARRPRDARRRGRRRRDGTGHRPARPRRAFPLRPRRHAWAPRPRAARRRAPRHGLDAAAVARLRERPLRIAAARLVALATQLDAESPAPSRAAWRWVAPPLETPQPTTAETGADVRRALKQLRLDAIESRRRMERLEAKLLDDARGTVEVLHRTPALSHARPRVSVLVSLYDYERHIEAALDSVALSTFKDVEVIVVDDASSDGSAERAARWLGRHPALPGLLVATAGTAASRTPATPRSTSSAARRASSSTPTTRSTRTASSG